MTTVLVSLCIVLGVLCLVVLGLYLVIRGADTVAQVAIPAVESREAPPVPAVEPAKRPEPWTTVQLVSGSGRPLGKVQIASRNRRASMQWRVGKAKELSNFVAQHQQNGEWTYRRVGVEREG